MSPFCFRGDKINLLFTLELWILAILVPCTHEIPGQRPVLAPAVAQAGAAGIIVGKLLVDRELGRRQQGRPGAPRN